LYIIKNNSLELVVPYLTIIHRVQNNAKQEEMPHYLYFRIYSKTGWLYLPKAGVSLTFSAEEQLVFPAGKAF